MRTVLIDLDAYRPVCAENHPAHLLRNVTEPARINAIVEDLQRRSESRNKQHLELDFIDWDDGHPLLRGLAIVHDANPSSVSDGGASLSSHRSGPALNTAMRPEYLLRPHMTGSSHGTLVDRHIIACHRPDFYTPFPEEGKYWKAEATWRPRVVRVVRDATGAWPSVNLINHLSCPWGIPVTWYREVGFKRFQESLTTARNLSVRDEADYDPETILAYGEDLWDSKSVFPEFNSMQWYSRVDREKAYAPVGKLAVLLAAACGFRAAQRFFKTLNYNGLIPWETRGCLWAAMAEAGKAGSKSHQKRRQRCKTLERKSAKQIPLSTLSSGS